MSVTKITPQELKELLETKKDSLEIVDVRDLDEYERIHIRGVRLLPLAQLATRVDEIDWSKEVVFVCKGGIRSAQAAEKMSVSGKDVKNLEGGVSACYTDWPPGIDLLEIGGEGVRGYI